MTVFNPPVKIDKDQLNLPHDGFDTSVAYNQFNLKAKTSVNPTGSVISNVGTDQSDYNDIYAASGVVRIRQGTYNGNSFEQRFNDNTNAFTREIITQSGNGRITEISNETTATTSYKLEYNDSTIEFSISGSGLSISLFDAVNNISSKVPLYYGELASTPATYITGDEYYNTGDSKFYKYNGTSWISLN